MQEVPFGQGGFEINPSGAGFIVYNIVQQPVEAPELPECKALIDAKTQQKDRLEASLEHAKTAVTERETAVERLQALLKSQQQDAASYAGIDGSGDEVAELIQKVEATRTSLGNEQTALDNARRELQAANRQLDGFPNEVRRDLGASLDQARYLFDSLTAGAVVKIGAVFVDDRREAVFYDFTARPANSTLHLEPLGDYPVVTHDERVYAIIANVDVSRHPYPFRLSASVSAGTSVNTEPVRPTFPVAGESAFAPPSEPVSARALRDVVLPIRDSVPPNGIAEVSIVTERPSATDPKKLETVTLVEKVKYPQFRARYRFNFATGVYRSSLRDVEFSKVKIADDNPETADINEARYRTDSNEASATVQPVFALSYYFYPIDIQSGISWRDVLPAPTIGFAFNKPHENVYVGFSHEPLRNLQVFWGWHFGMKSEAVVRNTVSEDQDAAAVVTRNRRTTEFAWGLSFNIAVIAKVFK